MDKIKSRKFWLAVISALLIVANQGLDLGLPDASIMTVAGIIISYILGQSFVDSKK